MTKPKQLAMAGKIPVYCAHSKIVALDTLKPNPRNPNTHSKEQVALLAKIISQSGWRNPIVVSTRSGLVVFGHCRLLSARYLAAGFAPVDYQDFASEAEEHAALLADNQIAELSEFDDSMSLDLLKELNESNFDLDLTGFTDFEQRLEDEQEFEKPDMRPAPATMWVLLAIPVNSLGDVREHLIALEQNSEIVLKTNRD